MGREPPSGTVTFLFTDVEGSTTLLRELGATRYAEALAEHRRIVRDALDVHGGVEVDTQGDAFFCAFGSARSAVACARDVTEALAATPIRVRIGMHTGEALVAGDHYVGLDVHRAARIGACGHGGQIVLSPSTVALLEPDELPLVDLGEHRLKDLSAPVRLHQLGDREFPPLKTLFRTNLPVPATPFLGRDDELRELVTLASEPGLRVVTLTGPGGTGKTRLALQLAAELSDSFPDGTWWVPLASLRDDSAVPSAVASALEVEEEPGRPLEESIALALSGKRALLLLDNCEHLVDAAAALVASLVAEDRDTLLLATSREALAVTGEHVYRVQPLVETDAVQLFYARARSAGARLDEAEAHGVVSALCGRLDNLPLAVELAAARTAALPPKALLERLSSGLDVLKGPRDVEERQRTLRATIAWSYGLLEEPEQRLFRRLGVIVASASLSAIEEVCGADLEALLSLVAKSLVRHTPDERGDPRYWMLETIREFAAEELERSGEADELRRQHARWFAEVARERWPQLVGAGPASVGALTRLEKDLENLRAAFAWFEHDRSDRSAAASLAAAISGRHFFRGRYADAEDVLRRAIALSPEPLELATLYFGLGGVLRLRGHPEAALAAFEQAERTLEPMSTRDEAWWERWLDIKLGKATFYYFQNQQAELAELVGELEPLVAEHGAPMQELEFLHLRCQEAYRLERYAPSEETEALVRETYRRAIELDDVGADFMLGFCLLWRGKLEEAEEAFLRGRVAARERGLALIDTRCLVYGTVARRRRNDVEGVREWLQELEAQDELHGYRGLTAANAAWLAWRDSEHDLAAARGEEALADWRTEGLRGSRVFEWTARFPLLGVALARGELEEALAHACAMLDESQQPLPGAIAGALSDALAAGTSDALRDVLVLAGDAGYA